MAPFSFQCQLMAQKSSSAQSVDWASSGAGQGRQWDPWSGDRTGYGLHPREGVCRRQPIQVSPIDASLPLPSSF